MIFRKLTSENKVPIIIPWLIACTFFMQMLDGTVLNTALPSIAREFGESPFEIQSVVISYLLSVAFFLPLSGWVADYFGTKKVFAVAISIFTLGSLFCAASYTLNALVLSRIFQGLGGALMAPVGRLIIVKLYPRSQLVRVLSFVVIPALLGPLLGPVLGGFMVEFLTWHWIFLINIPVGILAFIICLLKMPNIKEKNLHPFDWIGFCSIAIAIVLFSLAAENGDIVKMQPLYRAIIICISILLLNFYWFYSRQKPKPLFRRQLFDFKSFRIGMLGNILARIGGGSIPFITPLFLQVGLGFSPSQTGMMLLTVGVSGIIGKYFVNGLVERFGYRKFLSINTFILGLFITSGFLVTASTPYWLIVLVFFAFGFVNSLQFTAMTTLVLIDLPKDYVSEGNTLLSVVIQVSMSLGVSVGASMLGFFSDTPLLGHNSSVIEGFNLTYLGMGIITMLSSLSFLPTPKNAGK